MADADTSEMIYKNVNITDTGNAMSDEEIMDFSKSTALPHYPNQNLAVGVIIYEPLRCSCCSYTI